MQEHMLITILWWRDPQWWAIIVALMLGALAMFQDWIRRLIWKPKLNVSIRLCSPDCQKIPLNDARSGQRLYDSYYFRFRIENTGNYKMEYGEAIITEVNKKRANGEYKKLETFLPLNLLWAHNNLVTIPNIQPGLFKHLNFGYIVQSENANLGYFGIQEGDKTIVFKFTVEVEPNHGSHILSPGDYSITIKFTANNLSPVTKKYNLVFPDKWDDNEEDMLRNNIGIKEIS